MEPHIAETSAGSHTVLVVEQLLDELPGELPSTTLHSQTWSALLEVEIAQLHGDLETRYLQEECSGLYGPLFLTDFPEHTRRVERLKREHAMILGALRHVLDELWWSAECPEVETKIRRAVGKIRDNERDENDLLQQAYTLDLGVAG